MMLWVRPTEEGLLAPVSRLDAQLIAKLPVMKRVHCDVKRPRNGKHHRKFFWLMERAHEQQERFKPFDLFRAFVTVKAGYCFTCDVPPEKVDAKLLQFFVETGSHVFYEPTENLDVRIMIPRSLAWHSMDQDEFDKFYPAALDVLATEFGIDVDKLEDPI